MTSLILLKNIYYASLKTPLNLIKFIHPFFFFSKCHSSTFTKNLFLPQRRISMHSIARQQILLHELFICNDDYRQVHDSQLLTKLSFEFTIHQLSSTDKLSNHLSSLNIYPFNYRSECSCILGRAETFVGLISFQKSDENITLSGFNFCNGFVFIFVFLLVDQSGSRRIITAC